MTLFLDSFPFIINACLTRPPAVHSENDSARTSRGGRAGGVGGSRGLEQWDGGLMGDVWGWLKCKKLWKSSVGCWGVVTKVQKTLRSSVVGDEG